MSPQNLPPPSRNYQDYSTSYEVEHINSNDQNYQHDYDPEYERAAIHPNDSYASFVAGTGSYAQFNNQHSSQFNATSRNTGINFALNPVARIEEFKPQDDIVPRGRGAVNRTFRNPICMNNQQDLLNWSELKPSDNCPICANGGERVLISFHPFSCIFIFLRLNFILAITNNISLPISRMNQLSPELPIANRRFEKSKKAKRAPTYDPSKEKKDKISILNLLYIINVSGS